MCFRDEWFLINFYFTNYLQYFNFLYDTKLNCSKLINVGGGCTKKIFNGWILIFLYRQDVDLTVWSVRNMESKEQPQFQFEVFLRVLWGLLLYSLLLYIYSPVFIISLDMMYSSWFLVSIFVTVFPLKNFLSSLKPSFSNEYISY